MEPFASTDDLQARWRTLTADELKRATALLGDATVLITSAMRHGGVAIDASDEVQASALKVVCCSVVKRAMLADADEVPYTQRTMGAGAFSESVTVANPTGDLYLASAEKKMLGIGTTRMGFVRPAIHDPEGNEIDGW